ncbi:hypothetical protein GCM10010123_14300 [Pilimelia anulata]|uniref:Glycosyltransferase subfamily 4-like N-terminal domain-containing protein n=1 Tax=Pilimelia anulata TaxID=53371 RepID=A0A8J3F9D9_9ACTN|nr:glycosyltransferase family 4 protein [Pilimelia anulata]GGJ85807.1 hypothetical protein GCM10010123_14300 [Pilimelia anulata]
MIEDAPAPPPGHIVMLVDNAVEGDSRVQKTARTTAAAGWRVTLLGVSPDGPKRWSCGDARVSLLRIPRARLLRERAYRRGWRTPLAHPSPMAARRATDGAALRAADREFTAAVAGHPPPPAGWLRARWAGLRRRQTAAKNAADQRITLLDRLRYRLARRCRGDRAWRTLEPYLWRYETALGRTIDTLAPDIIHANDTRMLGVAVRAARRARLAGREVRVVWDAHEYLPGMAGAGLADRWLPAHLAYQREYVRHADAVVTVAEPIADLLERDLALPERPLVLQNVPALDHPVTDADRERYGDLRRTCGLPADTPLLVYSGSPAPQRGLDTFVEALPLLPGVHLALVIGKPAAPYPRELVARAAALGVGDRLHLTPYVPHWYLVEYVRTASVGLIGNVHWPNHELSLNTKFFEYSHAHLPLVTSDVRTIATMVARTGQGEVFAAEDTEDFARAVRTVLADPDRYRRALAAPGLLDRWTWAEEVRGLHALYTRLGGPAAPAAGSAVRAPAQPGAPAAPAALAGTDPSPTR